jgi:hypothetical protein
MFRNTDETIRCAGCGIEVTGDVWVVEHSIYCCKDCAQGLKCSCAERMEQEDDHRGLGSLLDTFID